MIGRRILQGRSWSSARNLLLCAPQCQRPPVAALLAPPLLGVSHLLPFSEAPPPITDVCIGLGFSFSMRRPYCSGQGLAHLPKEGIVDVPLAQTGEGIAECELLRWFVKEGDQVEEFQPLCEVQSDKATIEITSRYNGKVEQILYVPGDIVKVGETLLKMVAVDPQVPVAASDGQGNMKVETSDCSENARPPCSETKINSGVLSTPAVRSLAKQYGININEVSGTGKEGRILKEDVFSFAAQKGITEDTLHGQFKKLEDEYVDALAKHESQFGDQTFLLRGYQRAMVKSMSVAAKVPHFYYVDEINCDALVDLKTCFQRNNTDPEVKHTFLPILVKSLSMALSKYPFMNSCFNEETLEVILKGAHNVGIAMATPNGLVVPNIKNVQSLSILEITKELARLQQLALKNKLSPEDISGGTITLSNIGAIGGKFGSPLLNLPEVSIIALGRIQKIAHFDDSGNAYPVSAITVNIGADHRVLDGATVARFCNEWKQYIERPELLMLHMR